MSRPTGQSLGVVASGGGRQLEAFHSSHVLQVRSKSALDRGSKRHVSVSTTGTCSRPRPLQGVSTKQIDHNPSYHLSPSGSGSQIPGCPATKNPGEPLYLILKSGSLSIGCIYLEFWHLLGNIFERDNELMHVCAWNKV